MRRFLVGLLVALCSLSLAQVQVFETEAFSFSTDQGDASVSPTGILNELRERYKAKGMDLGEADARLVPLDITVTTGQGMLELDFTGLNVATLNVTSDQGDINIILSESGATSGSVTTGQGTVTLQLPASRSLAVVESQTSMGDILIDDAVNKSGTDGAVSLSLVTDMAEIIVVPVGAVMSEDMGMSEDMDEDMSEDSSSEEDSSEAMSEDVADSETSQVSVDVGSIAVTVVGGTVNVNAGDITVTDVSFSDEAISVDGMGGEQTFDCAGKDVVVNGTGITLTLTGVCDNIEINGATNTITVDAVRSLVVNGLGNTVTYLYTLNGQEPAAELVGLNNTLERKQ